MKRKAAKLNKKAYGTFTSTKRAQKLLYKSEKLNIKADAIIARSMEAKAKIAKNERSQAMFNEGISTIDHTLVSAGYKYLNELKDNVSLPVEEGLMRFLTAYLEDYRTTIDGSLLPMLAKAYDNTNNKLFKNGTSYNGQYKINGLRCFISAYKTQGLFEEIRLKFQIYPPFQHFYFYLADILCLYYISYLNDDDISYYDHRREYYCKRERFYNSLMKIFNHSSEYVTLAYIGAAQDDMMSAMKRFSYK